MQQQPAEDNNQAPLPLQAGGTYMVIADDSDEFPVALRYAARMAQATHGHVAIVSTIDDQEFMHWGNIEDRIRHEQRLETEKTTWEIAKIANEINGIYPSLYIEEGNKIDAISRIIEQNPSITMLILANSTNGPGPLVTHFSSKISGKLDIPVLVVPGHL